MQSDRVTKYIADSRSIIPDVQPHAGHRCPIKGCGSQFDNPRNIYRHCRETNEHQHQSFANDTRDTQCSDCGKQFSRPCDRSRHQKVHILVKTTELHDVPSLDVSLGSFDPAEDFLVSFYSNRLAPSRILSKAHDLYKELLELSPSFDYLRDSVRSVSASYLKGRFTKATSLGWRANAISKLQIRLNYITYTTCVDPKEMKAILGCVVLLLQYVVKDPNLYQEWRDMVMGLSPLLTWAIPFPETLPYRMRLAAHYVLANTLTNPDNQFPCAPFLSQSEESIQEIDGSICTSPQMLNMIQRITLAKADSDARYLAQAVQAIQQLSSEPDIDQETRAVILKTADTYRLGALEYIDCRFPYILPRANMQTIRYKQLRYYEELPLTGEHYRATHNLWGACMHGVKTPSRVRLGKVYLKMDDKTESNIRPAIRKIRTVVWPTKSILFNDITLECGPPTSMT